MGEPMEGHTCQLVTSSASSSSMQSSNTVTQKMVLPKQQRNSGWQLVRQSPENHTKCKAWESNDANCCKQRRMKGRVNCQAAKFDSCSSCITSLNLLTCCGITWLVNASQPDLLLMPAVSSAGMASQLSGSFV